MKKVEIKITIEPKDCTFNASELMESFANAKAKALLEEAAEKMEHLHSDKKITDCIRGYNHALSIAKESILSLIPKEK